MADPKRNRRWFQFSLRALLVFVLLASVGMSWLSMKRHQARKRRLAVEALRNTGIFLDSQIVFGSEPEVPAWLARLFGDDYLVVEVQQVVWNGQANIEPVRDEHMVHYGDLPGLWRIALPTCEVSDAGLEHLEGLRNVRSLDLCHTQVTDAGLEYLKGMSKLQHLFLSGTQVTDAGMLHLGGLTELRWLALDDTQVGDAGLVHLERLPSLKRLDVHWTQVTDQGADRLEQALPGCEIDR